MAACSAQFSSVSQSCPTLYSPMDCGHARLLCPWNFPGKNTGVGCHFPLQEIFLTQGLNPHLLRFLHWQEDSLPLALPEVQVAQSCLTLCDPMDYTVRRILHARILEWVAFPFSRGSSQKRDQTQVSHIAGLFFTR